jgi:hypothetical protein
MVRRTAADGRHYSLELPDDVLGNLSPCRYMSPDICESILGLLAFGTGGPGRAQCSAASRRSGLGPLLLERCLQSRYSNRVPRTTMRKCHLARLTQLSRSNGCLLLSRILHHIPSYVVALPSRRHAPPCLTRLPFYSLPIQIHGLVRFSYMVSSKFSRIVRQRKPRGSLDGLHRANWTCDLSHSLIRCIVPSGYLRPSCPSFHASLTVEAFDCMARGRDNQFDLGVVVSLVASHTR